MTLAGVAELTAENIDPALRDVRLSLLEADVDFAVWDTFVGDELTVFEAAYRNQLPVLLKGPTGCGKTRFMEHMAWRLQRPCRSRAR